jgi:hypothetical protein
MTNELNLPNQSSGIQERAIHYWMSESMAGRATNKAGHTWTRAHAPPRGSERRRKSKRRETQSAPISRDRLSTPFLLLVAHLLRRLPPLVFPFLVIFCRVVVILFYILYRLDFLVGLGRPTSSRKERSLLSARSASEAVEAGERASPCITTASQINQQQG